MKKVNPKTSKEHAKQQHCPTCTRYVKYDEQCRDYVCAKCVSQATDKDEKLISFHSITKDGNGIQGKFKDTEKLYRSTICIIRGIKCNAEQSASGEIVIRPVSKTKTANKGSSLTTAK
jgi:hypothetical protein